MELVDYDNAGRILSYMVAGAIVAALGHLSDFFASARVALQAFAALMLILMALYIANWWKGLLKVEAVGRHLWRYIEPVGRRLMPVVHLPQAFALGTLWGWLPCGLVYSMLAWSLAIADPLDGRASNGGFWPGYTPCSAGNRTCSTAVKPFNSPPCHWQRRRTVDYKFHPLAAYGRLFL